MAKRAGYSGAIFLAGVVAWTAVPIAYSRAAALNEIPKPGADGDARPLDRSCYVREENGLVRYYLDGPLRDGELPYLQGQPVAGPDGQVVTRDEIPDSAIPPRILRAPPCPLGKHHLP